MLKLSKTFRTIGHSVMVQSTSRPIARSIRSAAVVGLVSGSFALISPGQLPAAQANVTVAAAKSATPGSVFRDAVNAAMRAAQLTQTAKTSQDWQAIVQSWELAIAKMKAVPANDSNAAVAQRKAIEYTKNLDYARQALARQANAASQPTTQTSQSQTSQSQTSQSQTSNPKPSKPKPQIVQQDLTANSIPALLQAPLKSIQANPWLGKGAIVLAAATGLISLLTLEMKPKRARKRGSSRRDREAENVFFSNIGKGLSGVLAQVGNLPLQPSPGPLKSDKVQRKLFRKLVLLAKDEATAVRLIKSYLQRHPEHSMDWCCEKAIIDLQQST
jgi:hypothetical protein